MNSAECQSESIISGPPACTGSNSTCTIEWMCGIVRFETSNGQVTCSRMPYQRYASHRPQKTSSTSTDIAGRAERRAHGLGAGVLRRPCRARGGDRAHPAATRSIACRAVIP